MNQLALRRCRYPGNVATHRARPHRTNTDPPHATTTSARHRHENAPIVVAVQPAALQMGEVVKSPHSLSCYQPAALQKGGVVELHILQEAAMLEARAALCPRRRLLWQAPLWRIFLLVTIPNAFVVPNALGSNVGCHRIG